MQRALHSKAGVISLDVLPPGAGERRVVGDSLLPVRGLAPGLQVEGRGVRRGRGAHSAPRLAAGEPVPAVLHLHTRRQLQCCSAAVTLICY